MKEDKYMYNIAIFLVLIGLCWLSRSGNGKYMCVCMFVSLLLPI